MTEKRKMFIDLDPEPLDPTDNSPFIWATLYHPLVAGNIVFSDSDAFRTYIEARKKEIEWSKKHGLFHTIFVSEEDDVPKLCLGNTMTPEKDYSFVGIVFAIPADIRYRYHLSRLSPEIVKSLQERLAGEFDAFNSWVQGDSYCLFTDLGMEEGDITFGTYADCVGEFNASYADKAILLDSKGHRIDTGKGDSDV